ncbi:MAG: hypothetical protein AAF690_04865 [Acidobacteriota bacterium]
MFRRERSRSAGTSCDGRSSLAASSRHFEAPVLRPAPLFVLVPVRCSPRGLLAFCDEKIWGWKGIAKRLGVSPNTAAKYAKEKGLPTRTLGDGPKPRRFALEYELAAWERDNARLLREDAEPTPEETEQSRPANSEDELVPRTDSASKPKETLKGRHLWLAAFAAVAAVLATAAIWLLDPIKIPEERRPPVYNFVFESEEGLYANDLETGDPLWQEPLKGTTKTSYAEAHIAGFGTVLAVVFEEPDFDLSRAGKTLSLLDPTTLESYDEVSLDRVEQCFKVFPDYSEFYRTRLYAVDLDGDRSDEIVITYTHAPNLPACSLIYEPKLPRVRPVYASLGHHYFQGAADLDDDGHLEVIFGGISNRVSWYRGIAAVDLEPAVGRPGKVLPPARAPDLDGRGSAEETLLWFTYTEPDCTLDCLHIDALRGRLEFRGSRKLFLDRHGFQPSWSGAWNMDERQEARKRVYAEVRTERRAALLTQKRCQGLVGRTS